jgi:hypothetical protein
MDTALEHSAVLQQRSGWLLLLRLLVAMVSCWTKSWLPTAVCSPEVADRPLPVKTTTLWHFSISSNSWSMRSAVLHGTWSVDAWSVADFQR